MSAVIIIHDPSECVRCTECEGREEIILRVKCPICKKMHRYILNIRPHPIPLLDHKPRRIHKRIYKALRCPITGKLFTVCLIVP